MRAGLGAGVCLFAALVLARPAAAADPDEVVDLRVGKTATGDVSLTWAAPSVPADTYQVRRCALASLDEGSAGECIAEGLLTEAHVDPLPVGAVFYLVSGSVGGTEGSLGSADDGTLQVPRVAPPCSSPGGSGQVVLIASLDEPFEFCGVDLRVRFPTAVLTFVTGTGQGLTSDAGNWFVVPGENPPGTAFVVCASFGAGAQGPGDFARLVFDRSACPASLGDFTVAQCLFSDCITIASSTRACSLRLE